MQDCYQYTSLDPSTSELRLVTLANGDWDDPIHCHVHHVFLDEKPLYEALSYVWGDATITRDIQVSGHRFAVTINLETALRFLRLENEPRCLWIDAICINQNDIPERNRQVERMRSIYSSASRVLTWLGEESEDSEEGMAEIEDIASLFDKHDKFGRLPWPTGTPEQFDQLGFNFESRNWSALFAIFERKYWTRIWVVQELARPEPEVLDVDGKGDRGLIGCGRIWKPKQIFSKTSLFLMFLMRSNHNFWKEDGQRMEPFRTMLPKGHIPGLQMFGALLTAGQTPYIFNFMIATSFLESTDPRDKIYALLGLASKIPGFSPDYAKPVEQVYKELACSLIAKEKSLSCLKGNRTMKVDFSPSWAAPLQRSMDFGTTWLNIGNFYHASARQETDAHFDEEFNLLRCSGVLIGSLKTVIGPISQHGLASFETQLISLLSLLQYAGNAGKAHRENLWRTLVMDQDSSDFENPVFPAPAEFGKQYAALMEGFKVPEDFDPELSKVKFYERFFQCFNECTTYRCFFVTDFMHMGLGPYLTQEGDVVAVLTGGDFCFVLRPKGDYFELVGEAYVQGVMRGELMSRDRNGKLVNGREFVLC
jgi:hypothetical protein